jgi:O-methyltransferase
LSVLRRLGVDEARVHLVPGLFEETLVRTDTGPIELLHLDGDWYESTRVCLEVLYDRVVPGGYVVIDDYGFWPGARQATDEFRARRGIGAPLVRVDLGPVYWVKE